MAEYLNNLIDGMFGLIIVGFFILIIWAKISKKSMGEMFNEFVTYVMGERKTKVKGVGKKQLWQPKTI